MPLRVSVYTIYVLACLLAVGAAILSGTILLETFTEQQKQSEDAQVGTGSGQVRAMQTMIQTQMAGAQRTTDATSRQILQQVKRLPDTALQPENAIAALNQTVFDIWVPWIKAPNQTFGVGISLMYTTTATGELFDRSFWVYWEELKCGRAVYTYAFTNLEDNLLHAYDIEWPRYDDPQLGNSTFMFNVTTLTIGVYTRDDFFDCARPWSASDGNSYWYFTHMRSFYLNGVWLSIQTYEVCSMWVDEMMSILTPGAQMIAFDNEEHVMAATLPQELERIAECKGSIAVASVAAQCIDAPAGQHPTAEIRNVFTALYEPSWDDLAMAPTVLQTSELQLYGTRHMAIVGTLFSKDRLRITLVWYQPWVCVQGNPIGLAALICVMTLVSTFVLTVLGIFGVLRPLMALGIAMREVTRTLKDLDRETKAVLQPWKRSPFHEVEAIGKDFETIVVDFLGFSNANARDNRYAPKDPNLPFAVLFTDIQASTRLWGKDPVEMSRCVQTHHDLIRQLIWDHRLYEVKTVGDSFMVTTGSAEAAVHFALDLQTTFFDHDWGWDGADELYREATLAFVKTPRGPFRTSEYGKLWNGLRVRVGAHYGTGRVTYDAVSKGFDYYGTVVNAAARIEAIGHGGQIVVSEDLIKALPAPLDPALGLVTPLGTVPLRGLLEPPALLEVKPTRLQARVFPALRVEYAQEELCRMEPFSTEGNSPKNMLRHPRLSAIVVDGQERTSLESLKDQQSSNSVGSHTLERPAVAQIAEEVGRGAGLSPPPHWHPPFQSRVVAAF